MSASKKWVIAFESGAFLTKVKMGLTFFHDSALAFGSEAAAKEFLQNNLKKLYDVGLNPSVREIAVTQGKLQKKLGPSNS